MSISGKYLTAKIATAIIVGNYSWTVEEGADILDRTVGADLGHENEDLGVDFTHVTIKGYMDVAAGAYIPIRRGTIITALNLYRDIADTTAAFAISSALVVRSRQSAEIRGKVEFECEVHSKGSVVTYDDPGP
jgi:hypothetical protein